MSGKVWLLLRYTGVVGAFTTEALANEACQTRLDETEWWFWVEEVDLTGDPPE